MDTQRKTTMSSFVYHRIPTKVSRKDFHRHLALHLQRPTRGPKPKLALDKIFHNILSVLHTGMQWDQRKTKRNELHDPNVYKWPNRWSKEGSYHTLLKASIIPLPHTDQLDTSVLHGAGSNIVVKQGGRGLGSSGHKHQKGATELTIVEHHGCVIGPISVKPINQQDTVMLPETLTALVDFTNQIGIDLAGSAITLDAGFDSQNNTDLIKAHHMQPVIAPNRRNAQTPIAMARMFRWFERRLYRLRYKVERTFGWQDPFRKLVISSDRLPEIRKGCRLLAYSMINVRTTFNTS